MDYIYGKLSGVCSVKEILERLEVVEEQLKALEENKVDKVEGKVLSSNDYTDEDKAKVDSIN